MTLFGETTPFGRRVRAGLKGLLAVVAAFIAAGAGHSVAKPDISSLRVDRVGFDILPGWSADDHARAFTAFLQTCRQMGTGKDALTAVCRDALKQPATMSSARAREFFERHFSPHRVLTGSGLLTGYYEPVLRGSRVRTKEFNIPIYRRPADLVSDKARYLTREQIEEGGLKGKQLEILYLADAVDAFFLHIQGSGIVVMPDGERVRIGFDGANGYDYTSVGKVLIQAKVLARNEATLDGVKNWLRANPDEGRRAMWRNRRFIFFREIPNREETEGPIGAAGVPLVGGRSLAVDLRHYRLGLPIFLSLKGSPTDKQRHLQRLMIAQDTGKAIKGPQRGDIFWGSGKDAGDVAGGTYHRGEFFVLLPRRTPKVIAPTFTFTGNEAFAPFKTVSF